MNAVAPLGEGRRALLGGGRCELHGRRPDSATLLCFVLEAVEALRQPQHGSMDAILPHPGVLIEYSCAGARSSWNMSTGSRDVVGCDPVEGVETIARRSQSLSCLSNAMTFLASLKAVRTSDTPREAERSDRERI